MCDCAFVVGMQTLEKHAYIVIFEFLPAFIIKGICMCDCMF